MALHVSSSDCYQSWEIRCLDVSFNWRASLTGGKIQKYSPGSYQLCFTTNKTKDTKSILNNFRVYGDQKQFVKCNSTLAFMNSRHVENLFNLS